jgi:isoleucyl-tRNA synthetase
LVGQFQSEARAHFERYEFHPVVAKLQTFCSEDLGSFYLDILKDRLYTNAPDSAARRSAQTALWHISATLLRLMAPFLSFTAEEAYRVFEGAAQGRAGVSIFTRVFHEPPPVAGHDALLSKWTQIRAFRAEVLKRIEELREQGKVGSSLQAELQIHAYGERHALLASLGEELKFVTVTSRATLHPAADAAAERIEVQPSPHTKCERCWHYRNDVGIEPAHPVLCGRCADNLYGAGEARQFV